MPLGDGLGVSVPLGPGGLLGMDGGALGGVGDDWTDGSTCGVLGGLLHAASTSAMLKPVSN